MECTIDNKKLIPLSQVVNASIIDTFGDIGRLEQRHYHWSSRGLKKLYNQALPKIPHKAWLVVNSNTHTATLPLDYYEETFVGFVDEKWVKHPLKLNNNFTDTLNIQDIPCESKCPKCQQDTSICNDLVVTENTKLVVINNLPYNETTIKKLYPNGDYYLEVTTPILDISNDTVTYFTKKEFITNFDLRPCGCLDDTPLNTQNLINYCPDIYCNYYTSCDNQCNLEVGGYKIFEESGLIQMSQNYPFDKVYIEYYGFITKRNGQYYVPEVASECLIEWVKFMSVDGNKSVPNSTKAWRWERYKNERGNLDKILGRINLSVITDAINLIPKFNIDYGGGSAWYSCFNSPASITLPATTANVAACAGINGSGGNTNVTNNYITIINNYDYTIAVIANGNPGEPIVGLTTYQNSLLIGATLSYIIVNNGTETILGGNFTFNSTTGTIDRSPNTWFPGDVLIINYNKANT